MSWSERNTIEHLRDLLEGRRVLRIERRIYPPPPEDGKWGRPSKADYPVLYLDDGSEVILLDGDGAPPISEREKEPYVDQPQRWEGDDG